MQMPKKCIICEKEAKFCIKNSSEYYCEECAKEHFSDIELLQKVEEKAQRIKRIVDELALDIDDDTNEDE